MHIGRRFHEVDARAVHKVCPYMHLRKNKRSTRQNLGIRAFFNNPVVLLLIAFVFVNIAMYCLVLDHNTPEIVIGNLKENAVSRIKSCDTACWKRSVLWKGF